MKPPLVALAAVAFASAALFVVDWPLGLRLALLVLALVVGTVLIKAADRWS